MNKEELINQIARVSCSIVADADAQDLTTEDEVETIVKEFLSDEESLEELKKDAIDKADELLFLRVRNTVLRNKIKKNFDARLDILADEGADYGPLCCFVIDGTLAYPNVKAAVRAGLVDNWGSKILSDAEEVTP